MPPRVALLPPRMLQLLAPDAEMHAARASRPLKLRGAAKSARCARHGPRTSRRTIQSFSASEEAPPRLLGRAPRARQRSCLPATSLEPLRATSYVRGERYKTHHDVPRDGGGRGYKRRLKTIFAYLQADGELPAGRCGGATCFHRLRGSDGKSLRVYPRAGSAVMWTNYDDMGRRDTRTEHSGEEVTCPSVAKVGLSA